MSKASTFVKLCLIYGGQPSAEIFRNRLSGFGDGLGSLGDSFRPDLFPCQKCQKVSNCVNLLYLKDRNSGEDRTNAVRFENLPLFFKQPPRCRKAWHGKCKYTSGARGIRVSRNARQQEYAVPILNLAWLSRGRVFQHKVSLKLECVKMRGDGAHAARSGAVGSTLASGSLGSHNLS